MYVKKKIDKPFGEVLIERSLIERSQLNIALDLQRKEGGMLGEILVEQGFVSEMDIAYTLSLIYGFPFMPLQSFDISRELTALVPRRVAQHYTIMPIDKIGNSVTVATNNPLNNDALEDIAYLTKSDIQIFISTKADIMETIERIYG